MGLSADQERVKTLLKDTITLLCKNGLEFHSEFAIDAVIGITLDKDRLFYISMNDTFKSDRLPQATIDDGEDSCSSGEAVSPNRKRKKIKRRHSDGGEEDDSETIERKRQAHHESDVPVKEENIVIIKDEPGDQDNGMWAGEDPDIPGSSMLDSYQDGAKRDSSAEAGFQTMTGSGLMDFEGDDSGAWPNNSGTGSKMFSQDIQSRRRPAQAQSTVTSDNMAQPGSSQISPVHNKRLNKSRSSCCVPTCKQPGYVRDSNGNKVTFHCLPKNKELLDKWLARIGRDIGPHFRVTQYTRICSRHFIPTDFHVYNSGKRVLHQGVVPSVFDWNQKASHGKQYSFSGFTYY